MNQSTISTSTTTASAAPPPPKQGFRFHKSGSVSPIPPSSSSSVVHPPSQQQQQLALHTTTTCSHHSTITESSSSSTRSSAGSGGDIIASVAIQTPTLPAGVDLKLYQIVKRIVVVTPSLLISSSSSGGNNNKTVQQSRKNNTQAIINILLDKHREYRRKELHWVKTSVDKILVVLGSTQSNSNSNNNSGGNKKRRTSSVVPVGGGSSTIIESNSNNNSSSPPQSKKKRSSIVLLDGGKSGDSADDNNHSITQETHQALQHQTQQQQQQLVTSNSSTGGGGGGMLNASLRNRYKDVQRERQEMEQQQQQQQSISASTTAVVTIENGGSVEQEDGTVSSSSPPSLAAAQDDKNISATVSTADTTSPTTPSSSSTTLAAVATTTTTNNSSSTTTPKRKKKTKKTPSKSSSSNTSSNNFRLQQQDQDDSTSPYSSTTTLLQPSPRPTERYSNLGGITSLLQQLRELIEYPLSHPELFVHLGVEPPRGVLFRGPPGCGKTHLAKAIAGELNVSYFQVSAPELVGGVSGESELRVRTLFDSASNYAPAIIFIDEIDAIAPKRGEGSGSGGGGGGKSMEKRIVAQLLTSMDSIHPKNTRNQGAVMVLGATNRPDAMDPALRRAGRFDREIVLGAPDEKAREGILRVMTQDMRVDDTLDYKLLAKKTPGFVGADVRSLTKEAAVIAINRIFNMDLFSGGSNSVEQGGKEDHSGNADNGVVNKDTKGNDDNNTLDMPKEGGDGEVRNNSADYSNNNEIQSITPLTPDQLQPLYITMSDFLSAIPHVQPSSKREGFATVPDVSWGDIGALSSIREELTLSVLEPISHPERFEALGLPLPAGVLLYGPPGCGKTLLAKAIANESGANFISVKGPELLDKYVGESERAVRVVFERARSSSPCIIFFDELDSLCPKRGNDGGGGGGVSERVVNQLLTEMDGLDSRRSVFVIAATNRPELIDPAMLRPGRLDKLLYVPLPSPEDRYSILCALSKTIKLGDDVDLHAIAHNSQANGFSGADCAALLREAGLAVLRDGVLSRTNVPNISEKGSEDETPPLLQITAHHFQYAFDHVLPSVSRRDQARYDKLRDRMARARTRGSGRGGDASDVESSVPSTSGENND